MNLYNKYVPYFGLFTMTVFIILGFLLLFSDYFTYIPKNYRIIFAAIIIAYGLFRFISIILKPKPSEDEDSE
jgi:hypothetical protein